MNEVEQQLEQIEVSIAEAQAHIADKDALDRLTNNPDFKKIVLEGYFKNEAVRLVLLRADHNFQDDEAQAGILKSIDGIGQFRMFCNTINQLGVMAGNALDADESTREQLLAEDI